MVAGRPSGGGRGGAQPAGHVHPRHAGIDRSGRRVWVGGRCTIHGKASARPASHLTWVRLAQQAQQAGILAVLRVLCEPQGESVALAARGQAGHAVHFVR